MLDRETVALVVCVVISVLILIVGIIFIIPTIRIHPEYDVNLSLFNLNEGRLRLLQDMYDSIFRIDKDNFPPPLLLLLSSIYGKNWVLAANTYHDVALFEIMKSFYWNTYLSPSKKGPELVRYGNPIYHDNYRRELSSILAKLGKYSQKDAHNMYVGTAVPNFVIKPEDIIEDPIPPLYGESEDK